MKLFLLIPQRAKSDTYTLFKGPGEEFQDYLKKMPTVYSEIQTRCQVMLTSKGQDCHTYLPVQEIESTRYVVQGKRVDTLDVEKDN